VTTEDDEVHDKYLSEVTRGLPFYLAERLRNSIEQNRRWKAQAVANRLLGIKPESEWGDNFD